MKSWKLAVCAVFLCTQVAAEPASQASVEELLILTQAEKTVEALYSNMQTLMRQSLARSAQAKNLTPAQQKSLEGVPAKAVAMMQESLNWANMKPQFVAIYRDTFDQEEINGLLAFYRSQSGQALLQKMPLVAQKTYALSQSQVAPLVPKMQAIIEQSLKDLK